MADHADAQRAANLLRTLECYGRWPVADLSDLVNDVLVSSGRPTTTLGDESVERSFRRIRGILSELHISLRRDDHYLWLERAPEPADDPRMVVASADAALHQMVRSLLARIDPRATPQLDAEVLIKAYRNPSLTVLLADGTEHTGVFYRTQPTEPKALYLRTPHGDRMVLLRAIQDVRLARLSGPPVDDPSPNPPVLGEGLAVANPWTWGPQRGRPTQHDPVLHASVAVAALNRMLPLSGPVSTQSVDADNEPAVSSAELARATGLSAQLLRNHAGVIAHLDPSFSFDDQRDHFVRIPTDPSSQEGWSGVHAYYAATDLLALKALGSAVDELAPTLDSDHVDDLLARLREFLTLVSLPDDPATPSRAREVAAAMTWLDHDAYPIRVFTDTGFDGELVCEGLHWQSSSWWCLGTLDGRPIEPGVLALESIIATA